MATGDISKFDLDRKADYCCQSEGCYFLKGHGGNCAIPPAPSYPAILRLAQERDRLRAALAKYGRHAPSCETWLPGKYGKDAPCTCGLDVALTNAEQPGGQARGPEGGKGA